MKTNLLLPLAVATTVAARIPKLAKMTAAVVASLLKVKDEIIPHLGTLIPPKIFLIASTSTEIQYLNEVTTP